MSESIQIAKPRIFELLSNFSRSLSPAKVLDEASVIFRIGEEQVQNYARQIGAGDEKWNQILTTCHLLSVRLTTLRQNGSLRETKRFKKEVIAFKNDVARYVGVIQRAENRQLLNEALDRVAASAGPLAPAAVAAPDEGSTPTALNGVSVEIGPIQWGEDIEGEVRGLMNMLPNGYTGSRNIMAQRATRHGYVLVYFPTLADAIAFDNSWQNEGPPGYESVNIQLSSEGTD